MSKRLVYGVGVNDVDYNIVKREKVNGKWKTVWECRYYKRWKEMLGRCYSKLYQERRPTYIGCTVCEEWLLFSNFKKWMESQEWEGRQLDKDFLMEGNKVYSSSTCLFLPSKLNSFITTSGKTRGIYPLGVCYKKNNRGRMTNLSKPYYTQIHNLSGKQVFLGCYATKEESHHRYLQEKLQQCSLYLKDYKEDLLITKGLTRIYNKIQYHIENDLELTSF